MCFGQDAFRLSCLAKPSGNPRSASRFQRGVWGSERCAIVGFPNGLAHQDNPQIRVLSPLGKSQLTDSYSLPIRLLPESVG